MAFLFISTWHLAGTYFLHRIQEALNKFWHVSVYSTARKDMQNHEEDDKGQMDLFLALNCGGLKRCIIYALQHVQ